MYNAAVMPANLTQQYLKAEQRYRQASSDDERLAALEEMLRELPKHKGTDKMQADLRRRISQLRKAGPARKGGHREVFHIPPQGAGQVMLLGPPNAGKSSLLAATTNAEVRIAEFPFTTTVPQPGMMHYQDVPIQLVDTPPITPEHVEPGLVGALKAADLIALVVDAAGDLLEGVELGLDLFARREIEPVWGPRLPDEAGEAMPKRCVAIANKIDRPAAAGQIDALRELYGESIHVVPVSAVRGDGIEGLQAELFRLLDVIRVYSKPPHKPVDRTNPFILPTGSTVADLAAKVHRGLAEQVHTARIWGTGVYDGQNIPVDHVLHDKDVVELRAH